MAVSGCFSADGRGCRWLLWQLLVVSCRLGVTGEKDEERGRLLVGKLGVGRGQVREAAFEAAVADVLAGRTVKGEWEDKEGRKHLAPFTHLGSPTGACHGISYARLPSSPRRVLGAPVPAVARLGRSFCEVPPSLEVRWGRANALWRWSRGGSKRRRRRSSSASTDSPSSSARSRKSSSTTTATFRRD